MYKPLPQELIRCIDYFGHFYPEPGLYIVRNFSPDIEGMEKGIYLEEIVNPIHPFKKGFFEPYWHFEYFRELQPPMNLTFLLNSPTITSV